jgi:hypothetical protein
MKRLETPGAGIRTDAAIVGGSFAPSLHADEHVPAALAVRALRSGTISLQNLETPVPPRSKQRTLPAPPAKRSTSTSTGVLESNATNSVIRSIRLA